MRISKLFLDVCLLALLPFVAQAQFGVINVPVGPPQSVFPNPPGPGFTTTTNSDGSLCISAFGGNDFTLVIPSTINGLPVTSIGPRAFFFCPNLTNITIPSSVTNIEIDAFEACAGLTSITIPDSVTSLGGDVFSGCNSLTSVTIGTGVTSLGFSTFESCASLTQITVASGNPNYSSVGGVLFNKNQTTLVAYPAGLGGSYQIPNSVTSLGVFAFKDSLNLTGVTLPAGITIIGNGIFQNCSSLTSIAIPAGVTDIGPSAFYLCSSLASVSLPNGVTTIDVSAFSDCTSLGSITIPASVTLLGSEAFFNCPNLTAVFFEGNSPSPMVGGDVFGLSPIVTVYYRPGAIGWGLVFGGRLTASLALPSISSAPALQAVKSGTNASFSVAAGGAPAPTCQWQVSTDGGNTWSNASGGGYAGATTATLSVIDPATTMLGTQYRAVLTNHAGTTATAPVPLVVGTSTAKLAWLQSNFTTAQLGNPSVVGDLAIPANDGVPNLIKYAFNLNALANVLGQLPPPTMVNGQPALIFQTPRPDLTYTVQASADLVNWSTTNVTTQTNGDEVTASYTQLGATPVFLRLQVEPVP